MRRTLSISTNRIWELLYIFYTLGSFGVNMLGWSDQWIQIPLYMFFIFSARAICRNTQLFPKRIALWYTGLLLISLLSLCYSPDFSVSIKVLPDMVMALFWAISIGTFLSEPNRINIIKYSNIIISIPIGLYLALTFTQEHFWSRLGESFGMNENLVALCFLIPFCFAASEIFDRKRIPLNIAAMIVCSYVMLLSGSKKAMFGAIIFVFALNLFGGRLTLKKIFAVMVVIIGVVVVFYLIMHNEMLYNILGYRLLLFWNTLTGNSMAGTSTLERSSMILFGLKLFATSPIIGHGINSFSFYYGNATGFYAYAHNNFIELASTLGIIGMGWFYSIHFLIIKYYNRSKKFVKGNELVIAFLILILFYDVAMVSYYDTRIILLLLCTYAMSKEKYQNNIYSLEE